MTWTSALNFGGFLLAAAGSCTAMWGVFKQANGYYTFKPEVWKFAQVVFSVCKVFVFQGRRQGLKLLALTVNNKRVENRAQSLIGFFAVFAGFLLQLAGATLLYAATLADDAARATQH